MIIQQQGGITVSIDLENRLIKKQENNHIKTFYVYNSEAKNILSEVLFNNLAKISYIETCFHKDSSNELKEEYYKLKSENTAIIKFTVKQKLFN